MPWWTSCFLLGVSFLLWLKGQGNADDVIGLLEKILGITACMVVLLFGHNLLLELLSGKPPVDPRSRELLINTMDPALRNAERDLASQLDPRAGAWDARAAVQLGALAARCVEIEHMRCVVSDIMPDVDALAGGSGNGGRRRRRRFWAT